ncbi:TPA: helix-turn-helix domain-containing protein [Legionella pneumophila]|nr:hypothetical protein [Legionella pneumophila]HAU0941415.1 hypothetical protein [Legionella pneumophila]HDO7873626.1 helix-turn-helix domain-containing protein [Legionella pneumophila]HDO7940525.1 helix-turn-helix domain-containing protein [Legionella pneumophila]HDO8157869.1 helix-turn-helix domain-containing protein [Legionella pneumophila]
MKRKNRLDKLGNSKFFTSYSNSLSSQRKRILEHFKKCPRLSTLQARSEYGILHPGGRIMELRKNGYDIQTHWIYEPDSNGINHRVGLYIYKGRRLRS